MKDVAVANSQDLALQLTSRLMAEWLEESWEEDTGTVTTHAAYAHFCEWCRMGGVKIVPSFSVFSTFIKTTSGLSLRRTPREWVIDGITLLPLPVD